MRKPKTPVSFMGGTRFEGSVSGDGKVGDLNDLRAARFKSLSLAEVEEMIELLVQMRDHMWQHGTSTWENR